MLGARGGEKFRTRKNTLQRNEIVENTNPQFARPRLIPGQVSSARILARRRSSFSRLSKGKKVSINERCLSALIILPPTHLIMNNASKFDTFRFSYFIRSDRERTNKVSNFVSLYDFNFPPFQGKGNCVNDEFPRKS